MKPETKKNIKSIAVLIACIIGSQVPGFYMGNYNSDRNNAAVIESQAKEIDRLKNLAVYIQNEGNRVCGEQMDKMLDDKKREVGRIMNMCQIAATKSEQAATKSESASSAALGVLETVKDSRDAQVDEIRKTLQGDKK